MTSRRLDDVITGQDSQVLSALGASLASLPATEAQSKVPQSKFASALRVQGGIPLQGEVWCSGAKNSALGIFAASILTDESLSISNVPYLRDITTMNELLGSIGCAVELTAASDRHKVVTVNTASLNDTQAPYEQVRRMRASILILGPLLSRYGQATVPLPGGCAIGTRPVDLHIKALQEMGARISVEEGNIKASAPKGLTGANILFDIPTVTGTENIIMAATLAKGKTVIANAAKEPEIVDIAACLQAMGAKITGAGTDTITVYGVRELHGASVMTMPDRIECGTYLAAGVATGGRVKVTQTDPGTVEAVLSVLRATGAKVTTGTDWIEVNALESEIVGVPLRTAPYPGFPTDLQAQFMALNTMAKGTVSVTDTVFESRFMHVSELNRLGANIEQRGNTAMVTGVPKLTGAQIAAGDLRASAGLIIGGLMADGETEVHNIHHIDRGYECIEEKLQGLGARIYRDLP